MEIIKKGTPPSERIWEGECRKCGTVARCKQSELNVVHDDQRDGPYSWLKCPVCNEGNDEWGGMCFHPVDARRK